MRFEVVRKVVVAVSCDYFVKWTHERVEGFRCCSLEVIRTGNFSHGNDKAHHCFELLHKCEFMVA